MAIGAQMVPGKLAGTLLRPGQPPAAGPCIIEADREYSRRQVAQEVARCRRLLREQGVTSGDRVLALLDHDAWGVFFLAAASAMGLRLLVPYNLQTAALPEWQAIAARARPDFIVNLRQDRSVSRALDEADAPVIGLPRPQDRSQDEPAWADLAPSAGSFLVLFTSGTTGIPKAISISEQVICRRVDSVSRRLKFDADARVFMSGLLNNTTGVIFSFGAFLHGATLIIPPERDPAQWPEQVARHGATHIMLRPIALKRFLAAASSNRTDLSSLRVLAYGATALQRAVLREGRRLIPCDWVQGYGLSETYGPFCWLDEAAHREERSARGAYCVGQPDDTIEVRVEPLAGHPAGVGEVMLRGATLMEGYYDIAADRVLPRDGWFRTGDLGTWSPDGDLLLKGRINGTLMSGNGHRIYPEEVEAAFSEVPGVDEVVVIGVSRGETLAELPTACISGPLGKLDADDIRQAVTRHLGSILSQEKWPDLMYLSTTPFPKSGNDKIVRAEIAKGVKSGDLIELRQS